jgi:transposase-like protein
MSRQRQHHTPEQKVAILRRHLLEKVPVSSLCEEHQLHPAVFYQWQKVFFEKGPAAFQSARSDQNGLRQKLAAVERKLQAKNEVLAELMEEYVALKKSLGER